MLDQQLELLQEAVRDIPHDQRDLNMALVPDAQGIGVAAGANRSPTPSAPAKD